MISTYLYFAGILIMIISVVLSINVNTKFKKYSKESNLRGISGAQIAEIMLRQEGISGVTIRPTDGTLSDHYDPRNKTINLSKDVYEKATIASVAVAAHECGHAIQHNKGYAPLAFRTAFAPIASFGSTAGVWIAIIGLLLFEFIGNPFVVDLGILLFGCAVLFHFITLPVEFNASRRALAALREANILMEDEMPGARKVLSAAALTYVAAAASAAIQLLRLIAIRNND